MLAELRDAGVDTSLIAAGDIPTGHAIIQVSAEGQIAIVLFGGANRCVTSEDIDHALAGFDPGDYLLLQNEVNAIPELMRRGKERRLRVVFNPAPMTDDVKTYPLELADTLIVNETEGAQLSGEREPAAVLDALAARYPHVVCVLTLGERGVIYRASGEQIEVPAVRVEAIDTTAAGDTFIGYFLAELVRGHAVRAALEVAVRAAAICVTRPGAACSIPTLAEVTG